MKPQQTAKPHPALHTHPILHTRPVLYTPPGFVHPPSFPTLQDTTPSWLLAGLETSAQKQVPPWDALQLRPAAAARAGRCGQRVRSCPPAHATAAATSARLQPAAVQATQLVHYTSNPSSSLVFLLPASGRLFSTA
eukprot:scaffold114496_cov20-Tisochrysis_lutea.AAC.1